MSTFFREIPATQSSKRSGETLSTTFMMERSDRMARPARASTHDERTRMTEVWLAPKLNERISMAFDLLVLGPGRPSMIRYALTAIANSPLRSVQNCMQVRTAADCHPEFREAEALWRPIRPPLAADEKPPG